MTPDAAVDIARAALVLVLTVSGPPLLVSLILGLAVSLFQALTQVQEQTLTFVPKMVGIGVTLLVTFPMIGRALGDFTHLIADRVITG